MTRGVVPAVLMAIAAVHVGIGLGFGGGELRVMIEEGPWGWLRGAGARRAFVFWFLTAGYALFIVGHLAWWVERRADRRLPVFLGVELVILGGVAGVADFSPPAVAFVLLGVAIVWSARHGRNPSTPPSG